MKKGIVARKNAIKAVLARQKAAAPASEKSKLQDPTYAKYGDNLDRHEADRAAALQVSARQKAKRLGSATKSL